MSGIPPIASFINKSKVAQGLLKGVNNNPAMVIAVMSFGLASIVRPAIIGCFNFKDKKDKRYSQASAIAAGLIELGATAAIFIPLNKCIANTSRALYNSKGSFYFHNNVGLRQFKSITNRGAKLLALIPMSLARFSLVKPVVNTLFKGKEESKVTSFGSSKTKQTVIPKVFEAVVSRGGKVNTWG